jgi:hypothetical protein
VEKIKKYIKNYVHVDSDTFHEFDTREYVNRKRNSGGLRHNEREIELDLMPVIFECGQFYDCPLQEIYFIITKLINPNHSLRTTYSATKEAFADEEKTDETINAMKTGLNDIIKKAKEENPESYWNL